MRRLRRAAFLLLLHGSEAVIRALDALQAKDRERER